MIQIEFVGGPDDGTHEMQPIEIRPAIRVPGHLNGYYQLYRREPEEVAGEGVSLAILNLDAAEIGKRYCYLWSTKDSRGKAAVV
jgi:hypothetical protein